ncbi:AP-5 complex subunit zeta-1 protein [Dioscorea alata]|uniref:AP-5 complex subunit zeta-1 protein n=1 Tax=Dioscorea alata TaxID=55571 RepID=A0ACB7VNA2_DIOAL|nr:AP-5 complex subunit zeta-1 protein [Dioscorea alata]
MAKMGEKVGDLDFHLRSLGPNARVSSSASDPASDPHILQSVRKIYELCKEEGSEDLVARAYPQIKKLFHRSVLALPNSQTSNGLLLLTILQFFLDFGEVVLHDADPSLRTFFQFEDLVVAEATLDFINQNKKKFLTSFPTLLPQFFPLLLKLIAWNDTK